MVNSVLLQLLSSFTSAEFKNFGEYIRSTYFNKNEGVIMLYDYLKIFYPDFSEMNFEKKFVYGKLFGKIEYDDAFMRKLMFNLSKLAEDYLAYTHFSKNQLAYYDSLLRELNERGLDKHFQKKITSMEDELKKMKFRDLPYYEMQHKVFSLKNYIILKNSTYLNLKDKHDDILVKEIDSLVNYFLMSILKEYRFFFNFRKMVKYDFESESEFYKDIITYLKKNESLHRIPLLSLYLNSLLLLIEKNETYFEGLKSVLLNELDRLNYEDKYTSFAVLINFANDEYHKGNHEYLRERHELHKLVLENNLTYAVQSGEYFNDILFKNIVTVGLLMGEVKWTEQFIKDNIDKTYPGQKNNIYNLTMARLNFEKGKHDEALENLSRISTVQHFHYKPSIKALTLMIYIEKGWLAEAEDIIDAYRHFLKNDKLMPAFQKEKNNNFLKYCGELIKILSNDSGKKAGEIIHQLKNTQNVLEKEWLLKKL